MVHSRLATAALLLLVLAGPARADDPFQAMARKVVAGQVKVPAWQMPVYRAGLAQGVTVRGRAWTTGYYPWEGISGRQDAHEHPCTPRTASSNRIPQYSFVWIEGHGLRQVLDTGARSNDAWAERNGCPLWIDVWSETRLETHAARFAVVKMTTPRRAKR